MIWDTAYTPTTGGYPHVRLISWYLENRNQSTCTTLIGRGEGEGGGTIAVVIVKEYSPIPAIHWSVKIFLLSGPN